MLSVDPFYLPIMDLFRGGREIDRGVLSVYRS